MAGFHPAGRRIIAGDGIRQQHEDDIAVGEKPQHNDNNNDIITPKNDNEDVDIDNMNIDEIESDFSSDYDQPYHESASNWYNRHARRRARLLAGISSSSSSSGSSSESSDESCSGFESDEHDNELNGGGQGSNSWRSRRNKLMTKTIQSANRPLHNWLASYPCVAARCCLSLPPPAAATNNTNTNNHYYHGNKAKTASQLYNNNNADSSSFLPARESETKNLRRIVRRLRRKQTEFRVKFGGSNSSSSSSSNPSASSSHPNALSLGQQFNNNAAEATSTSTTATQNNNTMDQMAMHSFIPRGIGISFIDAVLARQESAVSLQQTFAADSAMANKKRQQQQKTCSRLVLELNGPARSGMTSILIAMAARYVVSTSNIFINGDCCSSDSDFDTKRQQHYNGSLKADSNKRTKLPAGNYSTTSVREPNVVILDLEKGVHTIKLILSIREAVLRRWEETTAAREWKKEQDRFWNTNFGGKEGDNNNMNMTDANDAKQGAQDESYSNYSTLEEQRQIEHAIASCLGRINVVQPRDFTYLSLVATIEALRHSLDEKQTSVMMMDSTLPSGSSAKKRKQPTHPPQQFGRPRKSGQFSQSTADNTSSSKQRQQAPTLILIDSLTTLDAATRFQESLPNTATGGNRSSGSNSGLSDRNEFYRQLIRLREEHEVAIVGASRCTATTTTVTFTNRSSSEQGLSWGVGKRGGGSTGNSLWDKMVSHRVKLHHVVEGTAEDRAGYDFVATLNNNSSSGSSNRHYREGGDASVFPYSVTAGGIAC